MDTIKRPTGFIRCLVVSVSLGAAGGLVFTDIAAAQQRTILDMLFGPRRDVYREDSDRMIFDENNRPARPAKNRSTKRAERPRPQQPAAPAAQNTPATPQPVIPSKMTDAKTILVVGDFMASGLAEGLDAAFMDSPGVRVIDKSDGSSGFVRSDHRDWPATIGSLIDAEKPAVVVVMIGANDRQQFLNGPVLQSEAWAKEYQARVRTFLEAVKKTGHPLVWVGQPSFKFKNMTNDLLAFNEVYRSATEKADGKFVDVWEGFVDQGGSFTLSGFDVSGQTVRLRNNDGIGLTTAGKRKLAFYAEKPLRQMLGTATSPAIAAIKPGSPVQALPETPQAPVKIDRIAPISLNDPELDGGTDLLGATPRAGTAADKSAKDRLLIEGSAPQGQPGRINDYSWPAKTNIPAQ